MKSMTADEVIAQPFTVRERDIKIKGVDLFCRECYGLPPAKQRYLFFYNDQGPFCSVQCYADFVGVDVEFIPKVIDHGSIKD